MARPSERITADHPSPSDLQAAILALRRYVQLVPNDAAAYNELGLGYFANGNYDLAKTCFDRAIALKPTKTYYNNLSTCLRKLIELERSKQ